MQLIEFFFIKTKKKFNLKSKVNSVKKCEVFKSLSVNKSSVFSSIPSTKDAETWCGWNKLKRREKGKGFKEEHAKNFKDAKIKHSYENSYSVFMNWKKI